MSDTLKISVVIPTCHRNDLLAKCLDCLAPGTQTLPADQYEVIVTDDGSQSTAEQMVREQYPWAQWVAGPHRGPAANRNNGAKYAKGEWLAFTDDDCLPSPTWLKTYYESISEDCHVYEGKTTCAAGIASPLYDAPINLTGGNLWSCNLMLRRSLFEQLGGFDATYEFNLEDGDMRERLSRASYKSLFTQAEVDHPPRKARLGKTASQNWEAHIHLWSKFAYPQPSCPALLLHIAKGHLRKVLSHELSPTTFRYLLCGGAELWAVLTTYHSWRKKYDPSAEAKLLTVDNLG